MYLVYLVLARFCLAFPFYVYVYGLSRVVLLLCRVCAFGVSGLLHVPLIASCCPTLAVSALLGQFQGGGCERFPRGAANLVPHSFFPSPPLLASVP